MKKLAFYIFITLSILSYVFAGLLSGIYFTQKSPGMMMIYLMPLLLLGMVFGMIACLIIKTQHSILTT